MPEGDTLYRTAYTLRLALKDRTVTGFRSPLPAFREHGLVGRIVTDVEARGKNLLIHFDDGRALYSHLQMEGSWHIYKPGVPWQKPERLAKAILETEEYIAICFNAPTVELLKPMEIKRHRVLSSLGPDLLKDDFDWNETLANLRGYNEAPIGVAVMRQNALAGIGNIYKSETLFLCGVNPFVKVSSLSDRDLKLMVQKARELMKRNLTGKRRATRHSLDRQPFWVYMRHGRPCRKCGTLIAMERQGLDGRSTYWCRQCQGTCENAPRGGNFC